MNVLVTGATGFIGRHLVRKLKVSTDDQIFCLVRKPEKVDKILRPLGVKCFYCDIAKPDTLKRLENEKIDIIYHCAAFVGIFPWSRLRDSNINGTRNICELAVKLKVKQLVYVSSIAVIVGNSDCPYPEDIPYAPTNSYGISKAEAEKIVLEYREKGLLVSILRPPIVYGEEEPHFFKYLFFLLRLRLFPLPFHGQSKLHMVYVKSVADALIASTKNSKFLEGTFYIADDEALSLKEIIYIFAEALGTFKPFDIPDRISNFLLKIPFLGKRFRKFSRDQIFSTERLRQAGFESQYDVRESLVVTADSF